MKVRIVQAVSSVRVGDGAAVGAIDLPLARERHTRWPFLPGSSMKGALREFARSNGISKEALVAAFGSEPPRPDEGDADELFPGSLRIEQATLLALPVRSMQATFALLTCPTALARFARAVGPEGVKEMALPEPAIEDAFIAPTQADRLGTRAKGVPLGEAFAGVVWLEDLDLVGVLRDEVAGWAEAISAFTGSEAPLDHLVVVHDDVFRHATAAWTEHRTRNKVGADGVVNDGFLFSVELLPPETLWWTAVDGEDHGVLPEDGELFRIGGHQSVGMGHLTWFGRAHERIP